MICVSKETMQKVMSDMRDIFPNKSDRMDESLPHGFETASGGRPLPHIVPGCKTGISPGRAKGIKGAAVVYGKFK